MQKRVRYHATYQRTAESEPQKIDVLLYEPVERETVEQMLRRRGYGVLLDLRKAQRKTVRVEPRWEYIPGALQRACAELQIEWEVQVRRTFVQPSGGYKRQGRHKLAFNGQGKATHYITVDKSLEPAEASEVLWHELTHASQAERTAREAQQALPMLTMSERDKLAAWRAASDAQKRIPYSYRPNEVEAQLVATQNAAQRLTRRA